MLKQQSKPRRKMTYLGPLKCVCGENWQGSVPVEYYEGYLIDWAKRHAKCKQGELLLQ